MAPALQTIRVERFGRRAQLAALAAALACVPFTVLLVLVAVADRPLLDLDDRVEADVHGYAVRHPGLTSAMRVLSTVATPAAWWAVLIPVTIGLLIARRFRAAVFVPLTFLSSIGLNRLVKVLVARPRPVLTNPVAHAGGFSFPSGHAQAVAVGCGILLVLVLPHLNRLWRAAAVGVAGLLAAMVCFARIELGVHFLSDVVAGLLLGTAWLLALTAAFGVGARAPAQNPKGGTAGRGSALRER